MSELYNTIAELCKKRDITVTELCRASGVSRAALSDLKMERKKSLSTKSLSKIADYLHELGNSKASLMFDGEPIDDETRELLRISLHNQLEISKRIAKQKFTAKRCPE